MKNKRKNKKTIYTVVLTGLLLFAILAAGYFAFCLWRYYQAYQEDQQRYKNLRDIVLQIPNEQTPSTDESSNNESSTNKSSTDESSIDKSVSEESSSADGSSNWQQTEKKADQPPFSVDWAALKEINRDIIGWVYFTGLPQISYPVLQAEDNAYYVNRTYDLSSDTSKAGSIFMDYRMASDFSSPYSIIYGHNVRDGSMLSDLALLKNQKLYEEEPYFWILTPNGNYRYQIFSIFQCNRSADVFQRSFEQWGEAFSEWQSELQMRNCMQGTVRLNECGHVIAFSTCVPNTFDRTIVCGAYLDGDPIPDPHEPSL